MELTSTEIEIMWLMINGSRLCQIAEYKKLALMPIYKAWSVFLPYNCILFYLFSIW